MLPHPRGASAAAPEPAGVEANLPAVQGITAALPSPAGIVAPPPNPIGARVPNDWILPVIPKVVAVLEGVMSLDAQARARVAAVLASEGVIDAWARAEAVLSTLSGSGALSTTAVRARVASALIGAHTLSSVARSRVTGDLSAPSELLANARARVSSSLDAAGVFSATAQRPGMKWRDDFPTDSTAGWGANWEKQSSLTPRIQSGVAVMGSIGMGSSGFVHARFVHTPMTTDVRCDVRVVKPPNQSQATDNELIISLRSSYNFAAAANNATYGVWFVMYPGQSGIITNINGNTTSRVTGGQVRVNDVISCTAIGNVYRLRNLTLNTTLAEWVDTNNVFPYFDTQNYLHMYQEGNYPIFQTAYGSYGADWLEFGDASVF